MDSQDATRTAGTLSPNLRTQYKVLGYGDRYTEPHESETLAGFSIAAMLVGS